MEILAPTREADPLLDSFLAAATDAEAETHLAHLLNAVAAPVIDAVLRRRIGSSEASNDAEDLASAVREKLIEQLLALRAHEIAEPIGNFRGYVSAVAYRVWAQRLREENPARSMLLNRIRYLLENRTAQRSFAIWEGTAGERWCGLARWRSRSLGQNASPKLQWLRVDPIAAARQAFGAAHFKTMNLAALLTGIFNWLEQPLELRDLVDASAQLLEISDEHESRHHETSDPAKEFSDPAASPVDELKWREYLCWLWAELTQLSLPQRTAFLLHSDLPREFDFRGIASIRQMASPLAMSPEEFAGLWNSIPLEDLAIAHRLGLQRQQVINLRRVARDRLGAAWKKWIG